MNKHNPISDESLDAILGDFHKSHMPKPWPSAPDARSVASEVRRRPAHASASGSSRQVLAASIAALLVLALVMTSGPRPEQAANINNSGPSLTNNATADGAKILPQRKITSEKRR